MSFQFDHIIEGINNKDINAWEELYSHYYSALCSYVNGIINNSHAAEDIVQDVLIKIWKSDKKFDTAKDLTSYLYKAAYNNSLMHLRDNNIKSRILENVRHESEEISEDAFAMTVREEVVRQLYCHIDELPEERKKILKLTLKGLSGPQVAENLGVSLSTVKTQKYRAFKFLRTKLKDSVLLFLI